MHRIGQRVPHRPDAARSFSSEGKLIAAIRLVGRAGSAGAAGGRRQTAGWSAIRCRQMLGRGFRRTLLCGLGFLAARARVRRADFRLRLPAFKRLARASDHAGALTSSNRRAISINSANGVITATKAAGYQSSFRIVPESSWVSSRTARPRPKPSPAPREVAAAGSSDRPAPHDAVLFETGFQGSHRTVRHPACGLRQYRQHPCR